MGAQYLYPYRGKSHRCGVRGRGPLKLNAFLFLCVQRKLQICPIIDIILQKSVNHTVNE